MSNRLEDTLARSKMILKRSIEFTTRAKGSNIILDYESTQPTDQFYNQTNSIPSSAYIPSSNPQVSLNTQVAELNHKVRDLENDRNRLEKLNSELRTRLLSCNSLEIDNQSLKKENLKLRQEIVNFTERDYHIHSRKIQELEDRIAEMNQNYEVLLNEKLDKEAHILKQEEVIARLTRDHLNRSTTDDFLVMQRKYEDILRSKTELQENYNLLYSKLNYVQSLNKPQIQHEITQAKNQLITVENQYKTDLLNLKHLYDKLLTENTLLRKKSHSSSDLHKNTFPYDRLYQTADLTYSTHKHRQSPLLSNSTYFPTHFSTLDSKDKENSYKIKDPKKRLESSFSDSDVLRKPSKSPRFSSRAKKPPSSVKSPCALKLAQSSSLSRVSPVRTPDQLRASPNCILTKTRGRCKICES